MEDARGMVKAHGVSINPFPLTTLAERLRESGP